jgi:hypothetical protein
MEKGIFAQIRPSMRRGSQFFKRKKCHGGKKFSTVFGAYPRVVSVFQTLMNSGEINRL